MDEVDRLNDAMQDIAVGVAETVHEPCLQWYAIGELVQHLETCPAVEWM